MQSNEVLFRCSALGNLMTEPRGKKEKEAGELSETTKNYLIDVYVAHKYGRRKDIYSKYLEKGLTVEEDSITLYSRVTTELHFKNEVQLKNDFVTGTPDLFSGKIDQAKIIIDIKSSWDIFTFHKAMYADFNPMYKWQLTGYMWLTNAPRARLAYCLVNTPDHLIDSEKQKFIYTCKGLSQSEIDSALLEIETKCKYDDIPMKDRLFIRDIERNDDDIAALQQRIIQCREFMKETFKI